ncbi:MAG: hypothetical protein KKF33_08260 [Alphaproteobacteria bacterium]|nr:hypothetical protein [Alphaproteobacteria bacterium]
MAISSDYPRPINVNGYTCRNCDDVSKAKRFIDPTQSPLEASAAANDGKDSTDSAVSFGGSLVNRSTVNPSQPSRQVVDRLA